jgi:hypothetical protein
MYKKYTTKTVFGQARQADIGEKAGIAVAKNHESRYHA